MEQDNRKQTNAQFYIALESIYQNYAYIPLGQAIQVLTGIDINSFPPEESSLILEHATNAVSRFATDNKIIVSRFNMSEEEMLRLKEFLEKDLRDFSQITKLSNALTLRCVQSGREPFYAHQLSSIQDALGNDINLNDVKIGDTIYVKGEIMRLPYANQYQDMLEHKTRDMRIKDAIQIKIEDIAFVDGGKYFIEYDGGALTNINFSEAWLHGREIERNIAQTELIENAIKETGKWFKPNTERLMKALWISAIDEIPFSEKRSIYNKMTAKVREYIDSAGLQKPFSSSQIKEIQGLLESVISEHNKMKENQLKEEIALKISQINKPVLYSKTLGVDSGWVKDWSKRPNEPFTIRGSFVPMISSKQANWAMSRSIDGVVLEKTLTAKDGSVFYITNIGIITTADFGEAYEKVLSPERKAYETSFNGDAQHYLSNFDKPYGILAHIDIDKNEGKITKDSVDKIIAKSAAQASSFIYVEQSNLPIFQGAITGYTSNYAETEQECKKKPYTFVMPGDSIEIATNKSGYSYSCENSRNAAVVKEVWADPHDASRFIIVSTDNAVFTSCKEIIEAHREWEQEQSQAPIIGEDR